MSDTSEATLVTMLVACPACGQKEGYYFGKITMGRYYQCRQCGRHIFDTDLIHLLTAENKRLKKERYVAVKLLCSYTKGAVLDKGEPVDYEKQPNIQISGVKISDDWKEGFEDAEGRRTF